MVVAAIGILVNGATALLFMRGSHGDLNIRGPFSHGRRRGDLARSRGRRRAHPMDRADLDRSGDQPCDRGRNRLGNVDLSAKP